MITDPISDMLTRIRNASEKRHERTKIPASRMSRSIANVLQQEGFIAKLHETWFGAKAEDTTSTVTVLDMPKGK